MNNQSIESGMRKGTGRLLTGMMLVAIGGLILLAQYVKAEGPLFLAGLAAIFLVWGLATRSFGLIIPGSLIAGVAAGAYLVEGPFAAINDSAEGGIFLLAFAGAWVLISLLSLITNGREGWQAWPLIPGGIIGAVGAALLSGQTGLKALEVTGQLWTLGLILAGLYLVFFRRGNGHQEG